MGCFGRDENVDQGMEKKRKVRDVLFLLLFVAFWGGMVYVAVAAFTKGNPDRLSYGVDSYGNLCGSNNNWNKEGKGPDLRNYKKLYWMNPLDLLSPDTFKTAKAVCVDKCPGAESLCDVTNLPCKQNLQYRCPYYRTADRNLYATIPVLSAWDTAYWTFLLNTTMPAGQCGINLNSIPQKFRQLFWKDPDNPLCGEYLQLNSLYPGHGPCYPVLLETTDVLNRCLPVMSAALQAQIISTIGIAIPNGNSTDAAAASLQSAGKVLQRYIGDIRRGFTIILAAGLGGGIVLALTWMLVLRYFAGCVAWGTIVAVNVLFLGCTFLAYVKGGLLLHDWGAVGHVLAANIPKNIDVTEKDRQVWLIVAYVMSAITALLILVTLLMIRRIMVAVACIKVASQAIKTMPMILFFPLLPFIGLVGLVIYWVLVTAFLYSAGTITPTFLSTAPAVSSFTIANMYDTASGPTSAPPPFPPPPPPPPPPPAGSSALGTDAACAVDPSCYYTVKWNKFLQYAFLYHIFGLLWTNQFIVGFGYVVIAGAIAQFYWTKGDTDKMPRMPVVQSVKNTLKYHLGSVAFGSLIVAIVQFVRILLEYIDSKTKSVQEKSAVGKHFVKYIMCCLRYCLWYLEKVIKFINRNAYILVAVHGTGYCTSAMEAAKILVTNALRVAAVNTVGDGLIFLGKLSVCAASGVIAFLMSSLSYYTNFEKYPNTYLSSPLLPVAISVLVGYVVAELFFSVYEMAVDTILLSFCQDSESHGGNPQYAPPLLLEAIGNAKAAKKARQEEKARRKAGSKVDIEDRQAALREPLTNGEEN
ncbi:hypothetical protein WJX72_008291 [[Myrmecia] bisecta]|uniref:Choline transporter-like protein n=1 Tax=[Myrmecia] bisecta TaxID=41462 RepID=A0AAW1QB27_9CHLO